MKPRAEGFTTAAILISHCERNLGRVKKPVGTGYPSFSLERKVCLITPTTIFMPMPSMRSKLWFFQFGLQILYEE